MLDDVLRNYKRSFKANTVGENSSFIFTVCVKSVPLYHLKFTYVVLRTAVKRIFQNPFLKMEK